MNDKPLIILDRDGVINEDSDHYIKSESEWIAIDSSLNAIAKLVQHGYRIVVATNQSGLSRGYFDEDILEDIHQKMHKAVEQRGGKIDAIEFCPDHPDQAGPDRKPAPGMLLKLLKQFQAKAEETWFIGDAISDIQCAINANCKPALVLSGKGQRTLKNNTLDKTIPVFEDLADFTEQLLS